MNSFVALQIMVAVETLWTLVAFEGSVLVAVDHSSAAGAHHSTWSRIRTVPQTRVGAMHGR